MRVIFSNAKTVVAWLGPDEDGDLGAAFGIVQTIQAEMGLCESKTQNIEWIEKYPDLCQSDDGHIYVPNNLWQVITYLRRNPY